jgi:membrane protein YqaA with SNARE-associated domain
MELALYIIGILVIIFIINVIPAFMPPTWILLSFVGFNFHLGNYTLAILAILAAVASSGGRAVLAILSKKILRNKIISESIRNNMDNLKENIIKRKNLTRGFFLFYAFSPFPSGQLFLAYGLTDLRLRLAIIPFFLGRMASYLFWVFTASETSKYLDVTSLKSGAFFSTYFILGQILAFYLVYLVAKIDWHILFNEKKIRFIKKI